MRRLETTVDLLDALQERHGWTSDCQVAEGLDIPQPTVSSWRRGRTYPTEVHAITIAEALDINPVKVLAIAAADRSGTNKKAHELWLSIARAVAISAVAAGAGLTGGSEVYAASRTDPGYTLCAPRKARKKPVPAAA